MDIDLWWVWAVVAVLVALSELHAPGYYLIWIALGAAVTAAGMALWELSLHAQLALFAAASSLSCVCGYFVYRRLNVAPDSTLNQRGRAMIGQRGTVAADFVNGCGKVRLGDSVWLAEGPDLAQGTPVVVTSVRGTSLLVEAAQAAGSVTGMTVD
jgi:inner membrane protein